jgi:hypothetical protein
MTKPLALSPEYRATVRAALRRNASQSVAERIAKIENATPSLVREAARLNAADYCRGVRVANDI